MANPLRTTELELNDPINDLNDGLKDPSQRPQEQEPPGFFSSIRNPVELFLEESIPASLYQWATGNTKKKQAADALKFLQQYPYLANAPRYKEAERIYKKFGYLLEEGSQEFSGDEMVKMVKQYPSVFGAELVNMVIADPYLFLLPSVAYARLGRGISNSIKLKNAKSFKSVKLTPEELVLKQNANADILYGAMGSVLTPLAFSTAMQLGEQGVVSGSRTTLETTIGATAGLLLSGGIAAVSGLATKISNFKPNLVNKALNNVIANSDEDLSLLFNPNEKTGNYNIVDNFYVEYKKLIKDIDPKLKDIDDPNKIEFDKRTITALARPLFENGVNASKNSAIKNAASLGAVFAAGSFLTAEDEKIAAAGQGFILGASIYGAAKVVNKFLKTSRDDLVKERQAGLEDTINAIEINSHKYYSHVAKLTGELQKLIPDPRSQRKIFHYIQQTEIGGRKFILSDLDEYEQKGLEISRNILKQFEDTLPNLDEPILKSIRDNYLPIIWNEYKGFNPSGFSEFFNAKVYGPNKSFPFNRRRLYDTINDGLKKGLRLKPGMDNVVELIRVYSIAAGKAVSTRALLKNLRTSSVPGITKSPFLAVTNEEVLKVMRGPYAKEYVDFTHPYINASASVKVHKDIVAPLKMIFSAETENQFITAMFNTNLVMKRLAVGFSFFHAGGLIENAFFTGLSFKSIGAILNPRTAPDIVKAINNPTLDFKDIPLPNITKDLIKAYGYDDVFEFARAGGLVIERGTIDQAHDRFYSVVNRAISGINNLIGYQAGTKTLGKVKKVFEWFDRVTWDRVYTGSKLFAFLKQFEKLAKPGDGPANIYANARIASRVTNDAFGGLNWVQITQEIQNPFLKKLAQTTFQPGSRGYLQLLLFAPDWTISNLRIAFKALPLFESNPDARRLYQAYFARTALIYATIGSALNYMFSGHGILENKDPTRIDLGNGDVLTFSKQFMEPFDWVTNPYGTGVKKLGSLPKSVVEVLTNKEYLTGKWSPRITEYDDNNITKAIKYGGQVGKKFLPIWVQQATETIEKGLIKDGISVDLAADVALNWFLGQTGHPKYKEPRQSQYKLQGLVRNPYETLF
jgi:hypothetical protein